MLCAECCYGELCALVGISAPSVNAWLSSERRRGYRLKKKKRLEVLMVAVFVNVSSPVLNLRHDHHDILSLFFLTLF